MNLLRLFVSIVVMTVSSGIAQMDFTELSGDLTGTLTADKKYHVVGDVYVPPGSSVSIEAGTVILFSEFTGLHVQGTLFARGSETQPIIFSSQHDSSVIGSPVPPAPFDWNGIDIYESAVGSELFYCNVRYSVYGIRSQTDYCKINSSVFNNNGKSDFTIKDVRKEITPGVPFSYSPLQDALSNVSTETDTNPSPETIPEKPVDVTRKKQGSAGKQILRYAGLALGVGGGAYSAISYFTKYKPAEENFKQISEPDEQKMRTYTSDDWNDARDERNSSLIHTVSGAAGAVLGILSFSLSFAF
ncbi:MAG: hypothetical protein ACM31E_10155 [Fibrobacterota bacterium]|nr:hypothetical protein [Chitinispirillaceae bacterium]